VDGSVAAVSGISIGGSADHGKVVHRSVWRQEQSGIRIVRDLV